MRYLGYLLLTALAAGCTGRIGNVTKADGGAWAASDDGGSGGGTVDEDVVLLGNDEPAGELCADGLDNDQDGEVDEGCACEPGSTQPCFVGDPALAGIGPCTWGTQPCQHATGGEFAMGEWGACVGSGQPTAEKCDGQDNDCNDVVDDGCECIDGTVQPCQTKCGDGSQICQDGKWSECDGPQPDQYGNCLLVLELAVNGDCVCAPACPPQAPFPVGCKIDFQGGNVNGCVATAGSGQLYFQEGVACNAGYLTGTVTCSSVPGPPLDATNCPINKPSPHWGTKPSDCPAINSGSPSSCYF